MEDYTDEQKFALEKIPEKDWDYGRLLRLTKEQWQATKNAHTDEQIHHAIQAVRWKAKIKDPKSRGRYYGVNRFGTDDSETVNKSTTSVEYWTEILLAHRPQKTYDLDTIKLCLLWWTVRTFVPKSKKSVALCLIR
ncbi:hypothetical protein F4815DRAFT_499236 [Daldinia loculata]|nr:hypothetical protein F4815DRAFT_499236 [Daldinia loculata]